MWYVNEQFLSDAYFENIEVVHMMLCCLKFFCALFCTLFCVEYNLYYLVCCFYKATTQSWSQKAAKSHKHLHSKRFDPVTILRTMC